MKHCFVVNPTAGKGRPIKLIPEIREACAAEGCECEIHETQNKGDAIEYVRSVSRQPEPARFYAVGGDGTLNDVLTGLEQFDRCEIASIPCGTGNDFIKQFPKPKEDYLDLRRMLSAPSRLLDYMAVSEWRCLNICNIGLDSDAAFYMAEYKKLPGMNNSLPYALGVLKSLLGKLGYAMRISLDGGEPIVGNFMLAAFGNGQYYGGAYRATPQAIPDDGLADVCLVDKVSRAKALRLIGQYKRGEHVTSPKFTGILRYLRAAVVDIECDTAMRICIDGEIYTKNKLRLAMQPRTVRFIIP